MDAILFNYPLGDVLSLSRKRPALPDTPMKTSQVG